MASGGARQGSGKPVGAANKQSRKLQELVEQRGDVSPGRVMLERMWFHYKLAAEAQKAADAGTPQGLQEIVDHLERAHTAAKDAAPYIHTRLASVVVSGDDDNPLRHKHEHVGLVGFAALSADDLKRLDDGQLAQLYREAISQTSGPGEEPGSDSHGDGDVPA